jgi:4-diphosphocytidyl-2-C-methyl-D-erythritol kinase
MERAERPAPRDAPVTTVTTCGLRLNRRLETPTFTTGLFARIGVRGADGPTGGLTETAIHVWPLGAQVRTHFKIDLLTLKGTITTSSHRAQPRQAPGRLFFLADGGIRFAYGVAAAGHDPKALATTGMYVRKLGKSALVLTPAKVNLSLEVLSKRADGFHEIETIIVPLDVFDTLEFMPAEHNDIRLTCRWSAGLAGQSTGDLPTGEKNIVWRAVSLVRERADVAAGADIRLTKRIPSAAGLGGASSDAAAALVAANLAWQLRWPRERLVELGAEIGSDVPFFLQNGASICRGRGERMQPLSACRLQIVVVRPPEGLSTPLVYQACRAAVAPMISKPL